jgi:ribose transport system substrate-binding protein
LQTLGKSPSRNDLALVSVGGTAVARKLVGTPGSFLRTAVASPDPLSLYACGIFCADWLEGKTIPQAIEVGCIPLSSPAEVQAFEVANANPLSAFGKAIAGENPALRFWGAISYETRANYLRNIITG